MADSTSLPSNGSKLRRRLLWLAALLIGLIGAWYGTRFAIESTAERDIFDHDQAERGARLLARWEPWMFSPKRWRWLQAEAARKENDLPRVKRFIDEAADSGAANEEIKGPIWLIEASTGSLNNARSNLAKLLQLYGNHRSEVYAALVQGSLVKGDHNEATQTLRLWREDMESDALLHYWEGVAATSDYKLNTAIFAFRKAIELKPDFEMARLELAELLVEQAKFEEAQSEYEWLVKRSPENLRVIVGYAQTLLSLGFSEEAAALLKDLKNTKDLKSTELLQIANINLESGNVAIAIEQGNTLVQRWPSIMMFLEVLAKGEAKLGNREKSAEWYKKASASQTKQPEIDQMLDRLKNEPNNQRLRRDMGEMMMTYIDPAAGAGYIEQVVRANPNDRKAHELLALYFRREKNDARAQVHEATVKRLSEMAKGNQ